MITRKEFEELEKMSNFNLDEMIRISNINSKFMEDKNYNSIISNIPYINTYLLIEDITNKKWIGNTLHVEHNFKWDFSLFEYHKKGIEWARKNGFNIPKNKENK